MFFQTVFDILEQWNGAPALQQVSLEPLIKIQRKLMTNTVYIEQSYLENFRGVCNRTDNFAPCDWFFRLFLTTSNMALQISLEPLIKSQRKLTTIIACIKGRYL